MYHHTPTLTTNPEPQVYHNRLCDDILRQAQQYASCLCELGAGIADRHLQVGGYAVKSRRGRRELGWRCKRIGESCK